MITAIIQARTGSTRLRGKVFADLAGKPLIHHVVERLTHSAVIGKIVLATTVNPHDDSLEEWGKNNSVEVFRGSEEDVLARYYHAAVSVNASVIIRVTADDPFKDPSVIDDVVNILQSEHLDFVYNNKPPSFPEGLDTEVFTMACLERAYHESHDPFEREHMTQYMYRHPELFSQRNHPHTEDIS
ncbi:MAG: cytidylyltransferase domain-containing protein, partial [Bacteroidota bacterium]